MADTNRNTGAASPPWLKTLALALRNRSGARLKGLMGGSASFAVSMLAREFPVAVIPPDPADVGKWTARLRAWLGKAEGDDPRARVHPLPPRFSPYLYPPHSDDADDPMRWASLAALESISDGSRPVFVLSPATLLQRLAKGSAARISIATGMELDRDDLVKKLLAGGYRPASMVYEHGEMRMSGEIVDVFPPLGEAVRVEFEFDRVGRIVAFDPASQRSRHTIERVVIDPVSEVSLDDEHRARAVERMKAARFDLDSEDGRELAERMSTGALEPGDASRYMTWFAAETESILDRLPVETVLVTPDGTALEENLKSLWMGVEKERWEHAERSLLPPHEDIYFSPDEIFERLKGMSRLELGGPAGADESEWPAITAQADDNTDVRDEIEKALRDPESEGKALSGLVKRIKAWRGEGRRVALTCLDGVGAARFETMLRDYGVIVKAATADAGLIEDGPKPGDVALVLSPLDAGFRMPSAGWAVVTEEEVFGPKVRRRETKRAPREEDFESFEPDKPVVHVDHGVGMFRRIEKMKMGGSEGDYAVIEYLESSLLYLPVHRMSLIEPYSGEGDESPALDRLGGTAWAKSIAKARKAVEAVAQELVDLYAARKVFDGISHPEPDATYHEFEAAFPYEETPDQARAIEDVLRDLRSTNPMDRVVCGDVGYGKTEVALRAAFLVAMSGKQVAMLVPTTLLADQHFRTFSARLKHYPLKVEMLSRFRSPKEQKDIIARAKEGRVDVLIGTHRLIQKDVDFKDLGLVIVDEEHRFGVKNKEKLKQMRRTVDVMSLSATPIPRTLQMSLLGVWDISVIETPPPDRLAVVTRVANHNEDLIRDAIRRELARGGQVFFVHNRIQGIEGMAAMLRTLVPEAKIAIGHGQMDETKLEEVMISFIKGDTDVLLSTAIIESGLDIPRANTIIINRAHTFGMASLYQLRGRVGRSRERGYAYLLIPGRHLITKQARERLRALEEFSELGCGYRLARLDMKIRGAGNILGEVQSGHIHRVGYDMYLSMLERAVKEIRGEATKDEIDPEIQLNIAAFLPEEYIVDADTRILFYRRLSKTRSDAELLDLKGEMLDRFGALPEPAQNLLDLMELKNMLRPVRVASLRREGRYARLVFASEAPIDPLGIVKLLNAEPRKYRVTPEDHFLVATESEGLPGFTAEIGSALKEITVRDKIN